MFKDKAFKYVPPANDIKTGNKGKVGADPKGNKGGSKGGRIRVQAGDKCVAPAKSRPKKRKAVGPQDESTLSMDSVQWSDHTYTAKALMNAFSNRFPLLVKVTKGYFGKLSEELSIGQVLQVHSCGQQKRTVVTDCQQRSLSVPLDYPAEVTILQEHDRVWMRLRDAVMSRKLPIKVKVNNMSKDSDEDTVNIVGQELHITSIHDDIYLKGNSIVNGWIDQVNVAMVPSFLQCQFSVAVGMRGASPEEWLDYQGMYSRSVRHLNYTLMSGYTGIYVDCDKPYPLLPGNASKTSNTQRSSDIDRSSTLPTVLPSLSGALYQNLPTDEKRKSTKYTNPAFLYDEEHSEDPPPHFSNTQHISQPNTLVVEPELHPPPVSRCDTPFSEVDENEVETMFDNVIRVGKETLERQQQEEEREAERRRMESAVSRREQTDGTRRKTNKQTQNIYSSHIESSLVQPKPVGQQNSAESSVLSSAMAPDSQSKHRGSYVCETSSGTPMGVIQPTVLPKEEFSRNILGGEPGSKEPKSNIDTMEDVPDDVTTLTVEDVCMCLKLLNMDSHISEFRRHQIDGKLLGDMRETLLLSDFRFTPFNASKLMRFVRGWRPKFI